MARRGWLSVGALLLAVVGLMLWSRLAGSPAAPIGGPADAPSSPVPEAADPGASGASAVRDAGPAGTRERPTVAQGLTGRVVDSTGAPLAGMRVAVVAAAPLSPSAAAIREQRGEIAGACADASTVADGAFACAVPADALGAPLELWAWGEGHGDAMQRLAPLAAGEWRDLGSVALPAAADVRGVVVAAGDDRPIGGAVVTAWPAARAQRALPGRPGGHRAVTDAQGQFRFTGLAVGVYDFAATALGHARADLLQRHVQAEEATVLEIALDPGAVLRGRVVDASGRGIAGAHVRADPVDPSRVCRPTARSDGHGGFEVFGVAAGEWRLMAGAAGFQTATLAPVVANGPDVVLTLQAQGGVRLRVVGRDGRPPDRCSVTVWPPVDRPGAALRGQPRRNLDAGDRDGDAFAVPGIDPGEWQLEVAAPGHAKAFSEVVVVRAGEVTEVAVHLPVGGALAGRVVDGAGKPVAGATVQAQPDGLADGGAAAVLRPLQVWRVTEARAATAASGAFAFEHLAAGDYQLRIDVPGEAPRYRAGVGVVEGASADLGAITAARGTQIEGTVVGGGSPPAPVFVQVQSLDGGSLPPGHVFEAAVGPGGRWSLALRLPGGRYAAMAGRRLPDNRFLEDADRAGSRVEFELRPGEAAREVALRLPP